MSNANFLIYVCLKISDRIGEPQLIQSVTSEKEAYTLVESYKQHNKTQLEMYPCPDGDKAWYFYMKNNTE